MGGKSGEGGVSGSFDGERRDSASTVAGTTDGKHKALEQKAQKSETKAMSFGMQKHYNILGKVMSADISPLFLIKFHVLVNVGLVGEGCVSNFELAERSPKPSQAIWLKGSSCSKAFSR